MSELTFVLGLGNQKCGTTWLHSYLQQAPNFEGGALKEYHIWDALDTPVKKDSRLSWKTAFLGNERQKIAARMQKFPQYYFDYFCGLFDNDISITADITPSYSGLGRERLTSIRDGFAARDVVVKPVILIRDPLSRIKSAVRFNLDRREYSEGIAPGETEFLRALRQYYRTEHCKLRTCYETGISNATEVFGEAGLYVGIYETMFQESEIERLSRFLGVLPKPDFAKVFVNKTKGEVERDLEMDQTIREAYKAVYDYCFERYPVTRTVWA